MVLQDHVRLVRDAASGIEVVHARFAAHAYDPHRHDEWLVGVTDQGMQEFSCRGAVQRSTPGRAILIEPQEVHDGRAGKPGGFAYRMLYLPQPWLRAHLDGTVAGDPTFAATLCDDTHLVRAIRRACAALVWPAERLVREAALAALLDALRPHWDRPRLPETGRSDGRAARRARELLHDDPAADHGADALARAAGAANRFELARMFRAAYGTAPHAYLIQLRLLRARRMLAAGTAPAKVAAACGFADQSHLGRRFRRAYGVTPAAYRATCTGVPDFGAVLP